MEIKGWLEKLGESGKADIERLRSMHISTATLIMNVLRTGGNMHGVDSAATAKRRKANKAARKARRNNR